MAYYSTSSAWAGGSPWATRCQFSPRSSLAQTSPMDSAAKTEPGWSVPMARAYTPPLIVAGRPPARGSQVSPPSLER